MESKKMNSKSKRTSGELETIIAYSQVALRTLEKSANELTRQEIKKQIIMLYEKFGNKDIKLIAKSIAKEKDDVSWIKKAQETK